MGVRIYRTMNFKEDKLNSNLMFRAIELQVDKDGNLKEHKLVSGVSTVSEDGKVIPAPAAKIKMPRGQLIVNDDQRALIAWLDKSDKNASNPNRDTSKIPEFYEYKPEEEAAREAKYDVDKLEVYNFILQEADAEDLIEFAQAEGIRVDPAKDVNLVLCKSEILKFYGLHFENKPEGKEAFFGRFNDPNRKIKSLVKKAVSSSYIRTLGGGRVAWGPSSSTPNVQIVTANSDSRPAIEAALISYFSRDEGQRDLESLTNQMKPKVATTVTNKKPITRKKSTE